jgi:hypothetical protein
VGGQQCRLCDTHHMLLLCNDGMQHLHAMPWLTADPVLPPCPHPAPCFTASLVSDPTRPLLSGPRCLICRPVLPRPKPPAVQLRRLLPRSGQPLAARWLQRSRS